ncbi:hypothetical protein LINGRAHAP2_LOCUS20669 [Linum grandiflorum]
MAPILLSNLGDDAKDVTLRLGLLNCWKAGNPVMPDSFFAYSTLWTDQLLTPVTTFEEVLDPGAGFVHYSFDFVPFDQLSSRLAPFPYLSDVVGRLLSISEPDPPLADPIESTNYDNSAILGVCDSPSLAPIAPAILLSKCFHP